MFRITRVSIGLNNKSIQNYLNVSIEDLKSKYYSHLLTKLSVLTPDIHEKVIHTSRNLQLLGAGLFKYVVPFNGYQTLKDKKQANKIG